MQEDPGSVTPQTTRGNDAASNQQGQDDQLLYHRGDGSRVGADASRGLGGSPPSPTAATPGIGETSATPELPIDPDLPSPGGPRGVSAFGFRSLLTVGLGGALGTLGRYELTLAVTAGASSFPWPVFVINVSGSLAIGFVLSLLSAHRQMGLPRLFICVGVLGGWTTMSSLAVAADQLVGRNVALVGLGYVVASLLAATLACALGLLLAKPLMPKATP